MKERREHERQPCEGEISFNIIGHEQKHEILPSTTMAASLIDLSQSGVGLTTEAPLEPGQILRFVKVPAGCDLPATGIVLWTAEMASGNRVGVQFME